MPLPRPKTKKGAKAAKRVGKIARKEAAKARTRDSLQALSKLAELVAGQYRIVSQHPIVVPARDLEATYGIPPDRMERLLREQFRAYRATLRDDHRQLLERFSPSTWPARSWASAASAPWPTLSCSRAAIRTTRCSCSSRRQPRSVLEDHLPTSRYRQHGERVVPASG